MASKKYGILIILCILSFFVTACSQEGLLDGMEEEQEEQIGHLEPAYGGTLNIAITQFKTLNPLFNNNRSVFQLHHLIYEGLVTFGDELNIKPLLAEGWSMASDGQSIEFTLRPNVTWHDGNPLTVEDVIFTIEAIKGNHKNIPGVSVYRRSLQPISSVEKINENTLKVKFTSPFSNGLEIMTFPIMPKHLLHGAHVGNLNNNQFNMVGTGPYRVEEYETMRRLLLKPHDEYWGKRPYIENIHVMIVPDQEAQLSLFENGELDVAQPIGIDWGKYTDDRGVRVYEFVTQNYEFLGLNFRNSHLRNVNVRKAIAYGIDRQRLIKNVYLGHATSVDFPLPPHSWLYDSSYSKYGYDLNSARKLLENAQYNLQGSQKVRVNEEGIPLALRLITNGDNVLRERTAQFIREELAQIGIQVEIELLEWEELQERIVQGNYDLFLGGWELSYIPDLSFAFHSSQIPATNFINYQNEEMDLLLETTLRASNQSAKQRQYSRLQEHIASELPYVSLFFQNGSLVVRDKVKGNIDPHHYNIFRNIAHWYVNTK